jgi:hypothetical protein
MLTILVRQHRPLTSSQPLSFCINLLINIQLVESNKIAHSRISTSFLALLACLVKPAKFIFILSRILGNASVLEGTEDVIWSIIFLEILGEVTNRALLDSKVVIEILVGGSGIANGFGLASRVRIISEDAVLDK